ncbi:hypothetical protein KJ758_01255 [Patescibacteria group bacterium]|nr:hypothetical protein [Patescibacteria group bacterium]
MKKMLPMMGLMATVACTDGIPVGTRPLNELQKHEVREDLDRIQAETEYIQDLLVKADPLFNIHGETTDSNEELAEGLGILRDDLEYFYENDHFVLAGSLQELQGWAAKSKVGKDAIITDNYIILQPDNETHSGMRSYGTTIYMHEAAHSYYDTDVREHNSIQERVESGKWESIDQYVLETNDVSYLMSTLYMIDGYTGSKKLSDEGYTRLFKDMQADPEGNYDGEKLEEMYKFVYEYSERSQEQYMEEFMREWFGPPSEGRSINMWDYYGYLGLTREELQETLYDHPELQESKRETAYWILDGLEEIYPSEVAEIKQEIRAERELREPEMARPGARR